MWGRKWMGQRGAEAMERRGTVWSIKTTSSIWVKSCGMIYSRLGAIPPSPPSICSTCLLERSEKLETVQEEVTIFSLGDQRHCGLTLKLKIHISMYSEMDTVCVITRHLSQICQLEVTREERVQSNVQLPMDAFSLKDCMSWTKF